MASKGQLHHQGIKPNDFEPTEEQAKALTPMEVIAANMHDRGFDKLWATATRSQLFDDTAKRTFLTQLATSGRIAYSASMAGFTRSVIQAHKAKDEAFKAACEEAMHYFRDLIQGEMYRRGVLGFEEEVLGGKDKNEIFKLKRYSDKQLENLGKIHIKEMQKEASTVINNNSNETTVLSSQFDIAEMPETDMAMLKHLLKNQLERQQATLEDQSADNNAIEGKVLPNE